jgi:hypothetical protein
VVKKIFDTELVCVCGLIFFYGVVISPASSQSLEASLLSDYETRDSEEISF